MKRSPKDSSEPSGGKPTHRVGAPPGPRKASLRRATLVEAARILFMEKGYAATTMDEIAARAGVAKGTLYHYFSHKADLLQVLRQDFEKEIVGRIRARVDACPAEDWLGRVHAWIDAAVEAYFDLSDLHDVVIYGSEMPFRNAMADSQVTGHLAELLALGGEAGAWRVDDERWTAVMMFYCFRGGCDEAMIGTQPAGEVPRKLKDLFARMLGVKP